MSVPSIQYVKTRDGVSIAYWTLGDGPPLVHSWGVASHALLEWRFPEIRRWYERVARGRRLISYEKRGIGMSQRDVQDLSLDAHVSDIEALVEHLGLHSFALFAPMVSGLIAVAYAALHGDQTLQLILWNAWRCHADIARASSIQAVDATLDHDWVTYTEAYAHLLLGWDQGEPAHRYASMMRESVTPELNRRRSEAIQGWDVTDLLPRVQAQTLVLQRRSLGWLDVSVGRELAASIPNAKLAILDGASVPPFLGDSEEVAAAIDSFLGEPEQHDAQRTQEFRGSPLGTTGKAGEKRPELNLSPRQREVLGMISRGMTNREIAAELVLSLRTVERHVNDIYGRLGVRNRAEAVALALERQQ
jgi:DNA-binding CsgD family transcriptional regulator/pimeloyl-ACP methyl ester carboxylesterase